MENKYTMEEFKEMFNEAEAKAMQEMSKEFDEAQSRTRQDSMLTSMLYMQNMMFAAMISKYLFKKN